MKQRIITAMGNRGNQANWILKEIPTLEKQVKNIDIKADTLVNQVERDLKNYIQQNFNVGEKLPAHMDLSKVLKVSIKTIHDAVKELIAFEEEIIGEFKFYKNTNKL